MYVTLVGLNVYPVCPSGASCYWAVLGDSRAYEAWEWCCCDCIGVCLSYDKCGSGSACSWDHVSGLWTRAEVTRASTSVQECAGVVEDGNCSGTEISRV